MANSKKRLPAEGGPLNRSISLGLPTGYFPDQIVSIGKNEPQISTVVRSNIPKNVLNKTRSTSLFGKIRVIVK
jgi:hypothetical protein